jgi:hypothetical protein
MSKPVTPMVKAACLSYTIDDIAPYMAKKSTGFQLGTVAIPLVVVRPVWKGSFVTNKENGAVFPVTSGDDAQSKSASKNKKKYSAVQVECRHPASIALVQAFDTTKGIWDISTTLDHDYNSLIIKPTGDDDSAEAKYEEDVGDGLVFRLNVWNNCAFKSSDPDCASVEDFKVGQQFVAHAKFHKWRNSNYGVSLYVDACEVVGLDADYQIPAFLRVRASKKRKIDADGNAVVSDVFQWAS